MENGHANGGVATQQQGTSVTALADTDVYGSGTGPAGYDTSIAPAGDDMDTMEQVMASKLQSYTAPKSVMRDLPDEEAAAQVPGFQRQSQRIIDREDEYQQRRLNRMISPARNDPFVMGDRTPDARTRTYADTMKEAALARERDNTLRNIADKKRLEQEQASADLDRPTKASAPSFAAPAPVAAPPASKAAAGEKRRNRWDQASGGDAKKPRVSEWDTDATPGRVAVDATPGRWDATPGPDATPGQLDADATPGRWDATPQAASRWDATPTPGRLDAGEPTPRRNRWDQTPTPGRVADGATPGWAPGETPAGGLGATPTPKRGRSRWDETPMGPGMTPGGMTPGATPGPGATPMMGATPTIGPTPMGGMGMETPSPSQLGKVPLSAEQYQSLRWEREIEERNRFLSDEELDSMLPPDGYKVLEPPSGYAPIRTPARKLMGTPTPIGGTPMYQIPEEDE
ncbi:hypothetical protein WJX84_009169, partial [Apatococcus fuscideae]